MCDMLALRSLRTAPSSARKVSMSGLCGRTISKCKGRASIKANSASTTANTIPRWKAFNMTGSAVRSPSQAACPPHTTIQIPKFLKIRQNFYLGFPNFYKKLHWQTNHTHPRTKRNKSKIFSERTVNSRTLFLTFFFKKVFFRKRFLGGEHPKGTFSLLANVPTFILFYFLKWSRPKVNDFISPFSFSLSVLPII